MADDVGNALPRSAARTREVVLHAATRAIIREGTGMSLGEVAMDAGVSRSGLLHHFGSREKLFAAVVEAANQRFRKGVMAHLDLSENCSGKLLRAYVRALCGGEDEIAHYYSSAPMWNGLYSIPDVVQVMEQERSWWDEQFRKDGLSPELVRVVRRAAEGTAAAVGYGEERREDAAKSRYILLEMTCPDEPAAAGHPRGNCGCESDGERLTRLGA